MIPVLPVSWWLSWPLLRVEETHGFLCMLLNAWLTATPTFTCLNNRAGDNSISFIAFISLGRCTNSCFAVLQGPCPIPSRLWELDIGLSSAFSIMNPCPDSPLWRQASNECFSHSSGDEPSCTSRSSSPAIPLATAGGIVYHPHSCLTQSLKSEAHFSILCTPIIRTATPIVPRVHSLLSSLKYLPLPPSLLSLSFPIASLVSPSLVALCGCGT